MGDELRTLTGRYETDTSMLEKQIRLGASFDLLGRKFLVGGQKATLYFVDGFAKDEVMEKILEYLMKLTPEEMREDNERLLFCIGEHRGHRVSGGHIDWERTARVILDEFRNGKMGRITLEVPEDVEDAKENAGGEDTTVS